jgi:hypothetical protein
MPLTFEQTEEGGIKATDGSELWWSSYEMNRLRIKQECDRETDPNHLPWNWVVCKKGDIPTHVVAVDVTYHNAAASREKFLCLEGLERQRTVIGGIRHRKASPDHTWTTSHCKMTVYLYHDIIRHGTVRYDSGHPTICIAKHTGCGTSFYWLDDLALDETFTDALPALSDEALYDLLEVMTRGFDNAKVAGWQEAARQYSEAFVEGRLKKRKQRGGGAPSRCGLSPSHSLATKT